MARLKEKYLNEALGKKYRQRPAIVNWWLRGGIAAAVAAAFVIIFAGVVNYFPVTAYAMSKIGFLGDLARAVTLDESMRVCLEKEYAQYVGNYYGTPKAPVEAWLTEGRDVVLEIEVQGGAQIKKLCPDCVSIFILPPSMEVLEKRLRGRGTEADKVVQSRLEAAKREIPCAREYDYIVYNDRLEDAVADVQAILRAEKRKYARNSDCIERVYPNA